MTRSGKFLCLITLGIGFGAVNTGNNLLFLLLGMLLALILASGILSEAVVMELDAKRLLPRRIVAGMDARGGYRIVNKKRFASLSIEVGDRNAVATAGPALGRRVGPDGVAWWKFWKGKPAEREVSDAYTLRLNGGDTAELDARFLIERRGIYELGTMRITTRFPFGLFEKSRTIESTANMTVLPAGADAGDWLATAAGRFGEVPTGKRGPGEDFFGLREYRAGEDRRQIHWRSTARRGTPIVRETERLTQREVEIVFCDWSHQPLPPGRFEHGVSKTAGLVAGLAAMGWRVGLRTRDHVVPPAEGAAHLDTILAALAVVVPHDAPYTVDEAVAARIAVGANPVAADIALEFDDA